MPIWTAFDLADEWLVMRGEKRVILTDICISFLLARD